MKQFLLYALLVGALGLVFSVPFAVIGAIWGLISIKVVATHIILAIVVLTVMAGVAE